MQLIQPKKLLAFLFVFVFALFLLSTIYYLLSTTVAHAQQMTEAEIQAQEAKWRAELAETEAEIAKWQAELNKTKQGTASLQGEAAKLQAKINEAKAFIRQREIQIQQLTRDIGEKTRVISELESKINRGKESLASILRATNEIDSYSLPEVMLSNENISEFFADVDSYNVIKLSLKEEFDAIRDLQNLTAAERSALDQKRAAEADRKAAIETDKKKIERDEQEKQRLITINKTQEKTYEQIITERQARAAQIRAELFKLRDTDGIAFGDALTYAQEASKITGVRPAFILGILQQESNIGQNVGSCVITDLKSGSTQSVNSGKVFLNGIHPTRDLPVLQEILPDIGRDPLSTKVSCPLSVGYGGAMGPAQFIPSTWKLYINRLKQTVGAHPDPWNPRHAFIASAMLLADNGADAGGYTAEHTAAAKYYAGGNWRTAGQGYANSVMKHAQNIQVNMIDPLEGY